MSAVSDRIKQDLVALLRAAEPRLDYFALYRAKVLAQSSDRATLDLRPDDVRLPEMVGIPLKHGIPGATVEVPPGGHVMIGWDNGDPASVFCALWEAGLTPITVTLNAATLELGGAAVDYVTKGTRHRAAEDTLVAALNAAMTTVAAAITSNPGTLTPLLPGFTAAVAALTAFHAAAAAAGGFLSTTVRVK